MIILILIRFLHVVLAIQATEGDDQQRLRFQVELEFVQCLANPNYLNCELFEHINSIIIKLNNWWHNSCLHFSSRSTRLLQRSSFRQLSQIPALLEEAWICKISEISNVAVFPRTASEWRISPKDCACTLREIHRRSSYSSVATLYTKTNKNTWSAAFTSQST